MTDILFRLISCSAALAALVLIITAVKKLLGRKLTAAAGYYLWTALFAAAAASCFPRPALPLSPLTGAEIPAARSAASLPDAGAASIQDFAVELKNVFPPALVLACFLLWLCGAAFILLRILLGILESRRLLRSARPAADASLRETALDCAVLLGIKRPFPVFYSDRTRGPATSGLLRPFILLPDRPFQDIKYILLHEMIHCKRRDTLINFFTQLLLAVNWFNPAIWYAARQMEKDREISCDDAVLSLLDQRERWQYGRAVINWASDIHRAAVGMGSSSRKLRQRISHIASYKKPTRSARKYSAALLIFTLICALLLAPSSSAASQSYESKISGTVFHENLSQYFGKFQGSFVLYDAARNQYTIYNEGLARARICPASTFKIYSGLLALETGVITADDSQLAWDGTTSSFQEWNQDQTLNTAMKNSVNWYFQDLDRKAGINHLRKFYSRIGYGNCLLSGADTYWMDGSLKISPIEQVILLTGLCENRWGFRQDSLSAIRRSLRITEKLSGKTGTISENGRTVSGWFIGYVKTASGPQIFALNLRGEDGASGSKAAETAQRILKGRGLL